MTFRDTVTLKIIFFTVSFRDYPDIGDPMLWRHMSAIVSHTIGKVKFCCFFVSSFVFCFVLFCLLCFGFFVGFLSRLKTYRAPNSAWWRHQMETFSALLAICAGNSPVPGEFPAQRPVTQSFDVFFDLRLNKRLSKQSYGWWLETLSRPLWRHRNGLTSPWWG